MIEVLFRVDDGPGIGAGHLMRCQALAEAVQAVGGRVRLLASAPSPMHEGWRAAGARVETHSLEIGGEADLVATLRHAETGAPHWLVADGYGFGQDWLDRLAARHRLLYLDDLGNRDAGAALVLNQNPGAEARYGSAYGRAGRALLGLSWFLLRRDFREIRPRHEPGRLLISLGGDDRDNLTLAIMKALVADGRVFCADVVSSAPEAGHKEALAYALAHPGRFIVHRAPVSLAPLMARAALAICGGGVTPVEAASLGVPALVKVLADNQSPGARSLVDAGVAIAVEAGEGGGEALARAALDALTDETVRPMMARRARALVDGQGAARVVAAMRETMQ